MSITVLLIKKIPEDMNKLDSDVKANEIIANGVFICKSKFFLVEIDLYRVKNSFVEVWYHPDTKKVLKIEILEKRRINPYLKHLSPLNLN